MKTLKLSYFYTKKTLACLEKDTASHREGENAKGQNNTRDFFGAKYLFKPISSRESRLSKFGKTGKP